MAIPIQTAAANVIVVDDNITNLEIMQILLECHPNVGTCQCFTSPTDLFRHLTNHPDTIPNLILLDIHMPTAWSDNDPKRGVMVFQKLRNMPALDGCPIVACTADTHQMTELRTIGFNGFVSKPINQARLDAQIERILAGDAVWDD